MWLQLKYWASLLLIFLFGLKPLIGWAKSAVKYKRLRYDEKEPGITVDQDELEVLLELENEDRYSLLVIHDVITGASPTGVPSSDAVSGASAIGRGQGFAGFEDERLAVSPGYSPRLSRTTRLNTNLYYSEEDDYLSRGGTLGFTFEINKKNTTFAPSVNYYKDRITTPGNPIWEKKNVEYVLDFSQVLNKTNVLVLGLYYGRNWGFLTDPYKKVLVGNEAVDENRPDVRRKGALAFGWRTQVVPGASLDLKYRYYKDDWNIRSHTLGLASLNQYGENWLVKFFYRYYIQWAAEFWQEMYYKRDTREYRSSDLRLSKYSSGTLGTTAIYKLSESWWLEASVARYAQFASSCGGLGFGEEAIRPDGNPPDMMFNYDEDDDDHDEGEGENHCSMIDGGGAYINALVTSLGFQYNF